MQGGSKLPPSGTPHLVRNVGGAFRRSPPGLGMQGGSKLPPSGTPHLVRNVGGAFRRSPPGLGMQGGSKLPPSGTPHLVRDVGGAFRRSPPGLCARLVISGRSTQSLGRSPLLRATSSPPFCSWPADARGGGSSAGRGGRARAGFRPDSGHDPRHV